LDTTALIDFSKGWEPVRGEILRMIEDGDELGICAINLAEFYTGVPEVERPVWDEFFEALPCWEIGREEGLQAGYYRWQFARSGQTLGTADSLIAAVARRQQAVILTDNVKDYPMSDVEVQSVR
jgi:predicted nucleic acid-binding protein